MPTLIPQYFYIDSTSFNTATSVYLDPELSICAPDGMYSNGLITRQLVDCVLLPKQTCYSCVAGCFSEISGGEEVGVYNFNVTLNNSSNDIGAVVLRFNPESVPDGILVTYDGNVYNKLYSPLYGLLESTSSGTATYIGQGSSSCALLLSGGTVTVDEYDYDGSDFYLTDNPVSVTVAIGQLADTPSPPGDCVMVIPKPNINPSTMNVKVYSLCSATDGWTVSMQCPELLTEYLRSDVYELEVFCGAPINLSFYRVPINLPASTLLQINDLVFQDEYGSMPLPDGFYLVNPSILPPTNDTIEVLDGRIKSFSLSCST